MTKKCAIDIAYPFILFSSIQVSSTDLYTYWGAKVASTLGHIIELCFLRQCFE